MGSKIQASGSLCRTIWRWHFYAGLFCIPFVIWLATTGSIFLFKPQIEALIDRPYDHSAVTGDRATVAAQVSAALAAVPGSTLRAYELPRTAHSAVRVVVSQQGTAIRVYIDPITLKILRTVAENKRLVNMIAIIVMFGLFCHVWALNDCRRFDGKAHSAPHPSCRRVARAATEHGRCAAPLSSYINVAP